ncbi:ESX secretion-associated protein EspG [Nocardia sp. NPDC051570]|uniref:ESX secretion-associated protein EspG n=1 Tax=Nocardia sp. NPDC051570 TaxID=3364324 RepID=UPI0037B0C220
MRFEFTADEMIYAFGQLGLDRWPNPLDLRPSVNWHDEWEAIERDLRLRFPVLDDPDLLPVLRIIADPETSLIMIGERKKPLRACGAITANVGVTMVQRPDPTPETCGNVVIEVGTPDLVPKVFTAVAGNQPPGRNPAMVETWDRVIEPAPITGLIHHAPTQADRMRDLLAAPRTAHGHIEIRVDRRSARPHLPRYISWFDVTNDGRYTYTRRHGDLHIDPCTPDHFRTHLTRLTTP